MDVVGDLVARDRRSDDLAFRLAGPAQSYTYWTACTDAWKAGNLLRQYGVRPGATVVIATDDPLTPQPLLAFLGTALLGGAVQFDPDSVADAAVVVAPAADVETDDLEPGAQALGYGAVPERSGVVHFERATWSENPTPPPETVEPTSVALSLSGGQTYTHERLLVAAESVAAEFDLAPGDEVAVRAPLAAPGAIAGGVLAPLLAGAAVLLDPVQVGTAAVGPSGSPEDRTVRPSAVLGDEDGAGD